MAPLLLKDYTWAQSDLTVSIHIPFNGRRPTKLDILAYDNYIKINAPPYWFELFLVEEIDVNDCKCIVTNENIVLYLKKKNAQDWDMIERVLSREEKIKLRIQTVELVQRRISDDKIKKGEQKRNLKENAVQDQIQLDSHRRSTIEDAKNTEIINVSKSIEEMKLRHEPDELSVRTLSITNSDSFPIPLVRRAATIAVHFSAREFPTPSRESKSAEESEFLAKQIAARKSSGFVSEDLRPEECNPTWLKNKGDSFFQSKNYIGAISAYSHAIKIGAKMPELYSNRSACHLKLGNLHKALEDVSDALELLTPAVPLNQNARAKCYARRGIILCQLGLPEKAIFEFEQAMKLRPDDCGLKADYATCKTLMDRDSGDDCD